MHYAVYEQMWFWSVGNEDKKRRSFSAFNRLLKLVCIKTKSMKQSDTGHKVKEQLQKEKRYSRPVILTT